MCKKNDGKWFSFRVGFGKGKGLKEQDEFLLKAFKPMTNTYFSEGYVDKFIYSRYPDNPRILNLEKFDGGIVNVRLFNFITFRLHTTEEKYDNLKSLVEKDLSKHKENLLNEYYICNDWGIMWNEKCYDDFGGVKYAEIIDDYLYQISKTTLDLLTVSSEEERKRLVLHSTQWTHMFYNQIGFQSKTIKVPEFLDLLYIMRL